MYPKKKLVGLFQYSLAQYFGVNEDRIFLFGAGRMGLFTVLDSIDHNINHEVIVAGYTCVVVTNTLKYAGYKAVYVDINEENLNISTEKIRASINSNTKAIIVTHNFGIVYEDIQTIKSEFPNIVIIEDTAHAFTSIYNSGQKTGLLADAAFFSLEYSKPLTTGMGGILLINNTELLPVITDKYESLGYYPFFSNFKIFATLKVHMFTSYKYSIFMKGILLRFLKIFGLLFVSSEAEIKGEMPLHYPVRLSSYLAIFGYLQLKEISRTNRIKNEIAKSYYTTLKSITGITMFYNDRYNYVRYPVLFKKNVSFDVIEKIKKDLAEAGFAVGEWFNDVVHPKGSFRYCYVDGSCKVGESVSKRILNFPINIHNSPNQIELMKINKIFEKYLKLE